MPFAAFLTHGGGGRAIQSIASVAQLKKAAEAVLVKGKPEAKALADLKALGAKLAGGARK